VDSGAAASVLAARFGARTGGAVRAMECASPLRWPSNAGSFAGDSVSDARRLDPDAMSWIGDDE
jgi:hypothetical protein